MALIRATYILELRKAGEVLPRRQDLPASAIVDGEMLRRVLAELKSFTSASEKFESHFLGLVVVSYCWAGKDHPDGTGQMIRDVLAPAIEWYLSERAGAFTRSDPACWTSGSQTPVTDDLLDFAVFVDYSSMYQHPRTKVEDAAFRRALASMDLIYAHQLTVKFRLTRSLSDSAGLAYGQRGWPFFETTVCRLASPGWHVFDLGSVDFTRPITFPRELDDRSPTGHLTVVDDNTRTLTFEGQRKPVAQLAAQASYCNAWEPGLAWALRDRRMPPLLPKRFAIDVRLCTFTNQADVNSVIGLQKRVAQAVLASVPSLHFEKLSWGPGEVRELLGALPLCSRLSHIDLGANALGDEGATCLLQAGVCRNIQRLELNLNQLTDDALCELGRCAAAGGLENLNTLQLWGNHFTEAGLDAMFGGFRDSPSKGGGALTELNLFRCQIAGRLPASIGCLLGLRVLSIYQNALTAIPEAIFHLKHLTSVDLEDNCLEVLPEIPCEVLSLTGLDLGGNQLAALPVSIGKLCSLQSLNLRGNRLSALPAAVVEMRALKKVNVKGNGAELTAWLATSPPLLASLQASGIEVLADVPTAQEA